MTWLLTSFLILIMWNDTDTPLAYFISFRIYGTWLRGDKRGSVDRFQNRSEERKCACELKVKLDSAPPPNAVGRIFQLGL